MIRSSRLLGRHGAFGLGAAIAAACLLLGAPDASAQAGAVTGTVTDAGTGEPVSGAQVFIRGTNLGTLSGADGSYRLTGVPAGNRTVRVRLIGYETASQSVQVQSGQATTADFQLTQTALRLQEVVVTGVAAETPQVKLPFTVERLSGDELNNVPSSDISGILQGKAAGVTVISSSGQPGAQSDILLRGQTSINSSGRSQGPLVVIDGVIQSTGGSLSDINTLDIESLEVVKGAAAASMYGSRAQNGVIVIETKSGASLEQEAENFDITMRAERGVSSLGREYPSANFHVMQMNDSQTEFLDRDGNAVENPGSYVKESDCIDAGGNGCFQDNPYPSPFDNLENFFDPGSNMSLYGAIAGATGQTNLRVSGEYYDEAGTILNNQGYDRFNGRFNINHSVGQEFDIQGTAFVSRSNQDPVPGSPGDRNGQAGNGFFGVLFQSPAIDISRKTTRGQRDADECDGGAADDCWFVVVPDPTAAVDRENPLFAEQAFLGNSRVQRVMGSASTSWSPLSWFSLDATFSYDRTDQHSFDFERRGTPQGEGSGTSDGFMSQDNFEQQALNGSVTANLSGTFLDNELTVRGRARYLVEDQETRSFFGNGEGLSVKGVQTLDALSNTETFGLGSTRTRIKSQNYFAIASVDYKDRYILDGLVRRDGSSLFGPQSRWNTYYRVSGAYRVSEEPWFNLPGVSDLKLRYSRGTAGSRPRFDQRFETFSLGAGGSVTFNTLGNVNLAPEHTVEQEAGFDLSLGDRVTVTGTYAHSKTDDQLLPVPLPGFFGFATQWQNVGTLKAETFEGSVEATLVSRQDLGWNVRVSAFKTSETITDLGVPAFRYGPSTQSGDVFFAREGESLGTFYGQDFIEDCQDLNTTFGISQSACQSNFDVNNHGYLVYVGQGNSWRSGPGPDGQVQTSDDLWGSSATVEGETFDWGAPMVAERVDQLCLENNPEATEEDCTTDFLPLGSSSEDINFSLSNNFRWKGLTVYGLLDATLGVDVLNGTAEWPQDPKTRGVGVDYKGAEAVNMPASHKKPLKYYDDWTNGSNDFFTEDGSYLKVRELSVTYSFPTSLVSQIPWAGGQVDAASISVVGRNLFTFTDYRGYDPEVGFGSGTGASGQTGSAANARFDRFQYPNFRTITASVELVF